MREGSESDRMSIEKMKSIAFPKHSFDDWKEEAIQSLKGKPYEELISSTFEGIDLQPLYTAEHLHNTVNYGDTISRAKLDATWLVAQVMSGDSAKDFLEQARIQLERGNEVIVYDGSPTPYSWSDEEQNELAMLLKKNTFYFKVKNPKDEILDVFTLFSEEERSSLKGYMGGLSSDVAKTVISTNEIHDLGGTAIHELAYALVGFSKFAETNPSFSSQLAVQFSIDTNFFMEIAKLRAFRILWKAFSKAFDANHVSLPVLAETSMRSFSKLDPTVNLLRAGNATFAAVLGGAELITVHPHDVLTGNSPSSERIARNVQLVIREETMVTKFVDPSAGSYYVESLTTELVHRAWSLFLTVQDLQSDKQLGYLISLAEETQTMRKHAMAKRKSSLIGTNVYSNPVDELSLTPVDVHANRLSIPFETLRAHFKSTPFKSAILSFGVLKEVKPRVDFVQGFLQAGGLDPDISPVFNTADDAFRWAKTNGYSYIVIAAKDEVTKEVLPEFLRFASTNSFIIDVAGKFKEEGNWQSTGLNGAIYAGQDLIEKMQQLISVQKEGGNSEQA